jgi:hypothetical protein
VKIKSFVPNFLGKTVKYHVPNKRLRSHFFWCPHATIGNFDINSKKIRLK